MVVVQQLEEDKVILQDGSGSTIGGGDSNIASGDTSIIGGGGFNTASGDLSIIGGGVT